MKLKESHQIQQDVEYAGHLYIERAKQAPVGHAELLKISEEINSAEG